MQNHDQKFKFAIFSKLKLKTFEMTFYFEQWAYHYGQKRDIKSFVKKERLISHLKITIGF